MKIAGLITVRTSSSRLAQKCLLPFGEASVIEHIISRTAHYNIEPIVCTSSHNSDDILEEISRKRGVRFFRGHLDNKLLRWKTCCDQLSLEAFHTIDADDLFFCGDTMKKSFSLLSPDHPIIYPSDYSAAGGGTTGYSMNASVLASICENIPENTDTEMVDSFFRQIPSIAVQELTANQILARFTLDYHEDFIFLESIRLLLGKMCSRNEINTLLAANPDLMRINWFRNQEWKARQNKKKEMRIANVGQ